MFQVGDKIFYPMHGAGIIEAIEEKEILGEKQTYYIININNIQVMFPRNKVSNIGIREIVDLEILESALTGFNGEISELVKNPSQRYRSYMSKLKTGDIHEGIQVIRDLAHISKKKNLAVADKAMLSNALQILSSELGLVKGIEQEEADLMLNELISEID